jgi:hypothetical protein
MTNQHQPTGLLLQLLGDLSRDPALCDRLIADAAAVIDSYALTPVAYAALRSRDLDQITSEAAREARGVIEHLRAIVPDVALPWPTSDPVINAISPNRGAINTVLTVVVTGKFFQTGATLTFQSPTNSYKATNIRVATTPDGRSTMNAQVTIAQPSSYDVIVTNPAGISATLSSGFTAVNPPPVP